MATSVDPGYEAVALGRKLGEHENVELSAHPITGDLAASCNDCGRMWIYQAGGKLNEYTPPCTPEEED